MRNAEFWYEMIPGPSRLIDKIAKTIIDCSTAILCIDYDFPWRNEMRDEVEKRLRKYPDAPSMQYLDISDQYRDEGIARFVVHQYCSEEDYVFASKESHAINTLKNGFLKDRVVWFKGIPAGLEKNIISFCRNYKTFSKKEGVFVVELREENLGKEKLPGNIQLIRSSDFITEDDVLIFSSLLYAHRGEQGQYGKYFSNLVSSICGKDAELASEMISTIDFHSIEPIEGLKMVKESSFCESERGVSLQSDPNHPFALLKHGNYTELQSRVWIAQIRVIMAVVEKERQQFISKYSDDLHFCYYEILNNQNAWKNINFKIGYDDTEDRNYLENQFGEYIRDINDFEVNHLYQLAKISRKDDPDNHLLYLPYREYKRLEFLRDIRNALSHITCCSADTIEKLFDLDRMC